MLYVSFLNNNYVFIFQSNFKLKFDQYTSIYALLKTILLYVVRLLYQRNALPLEDPRASLQCINIEDKIMTLCK